MKARLFAAFLGFSAAALSIAAPAAAQNAVDPDPESISITVHKHRYQTAENPVSMRPDGSISDGLAAPISGVVFTAYPIALSDATGALSMLDQAAWDIAQALSATELGSSCEAAQTAVATVAGASMSGQALAFPATDSGGVAKLQLGVVGTATEAFGLGAYLLCETSAGSNQVVSRAAPFIAMIPFPFEYTQGGVAAFSWVYELHVYPKNSVTALSMDVAAPASLGLGSAVVWKIVALLPHAPEGITSFTVTDTLDSRLSYTSAAVALSDGAALAAGDYAITPPAGENPLTLSFTPAGLTKLALGAAAGASVEFSVTTAVEEVGEIPNSAAVTINGVTYPTNSASTSWGDQRIRNNDPEGQPLASVEVEVLPGTTDAATGRCTAALAALPISVGGETRFISAPDGSALIPGLFVTDSNGTVTPCYILRQAKVPIGYVQPIEGAELTPITVTPGASTDFDLVITNVRQKAPTLPLTGANTELILIISGAAMLVLAGGIGLYQRFGRFGRFGRPAPLD